MKGAQKLFTLISLLTGYLVCSLWAAEISVNDHNGVFSSVDKENGGNETDPFDNWLAPYDIRKNYPYYLAGHDEEGRPIWAFEFGKWDIKKIVEGGKEKMASFERYHKQFFHRVQKGLALINQEHEVSGKHEVGWVFIMDMENFNLKQLQSAQTVAFQLKIMQVVDLNARTMDYGYIVNVNFVANSFLNTMKPVLGATLQRAEIFGTVKSRWQSKILRTIHKSQLPPWYGGDKKNYKPLAVYG